jgi:hypothetical protein
MIMSLIFPRIAVEGNAVPNSETNWVCALWISRASSSYSRISSEVKLTSYSKVEFEISTVDTDCENMNRDGSSDKVVPLDDPGVPGLGVVRKYNPP